MYIYSDYQWKSVCVFILPVIVDSASVKMNKVSIIWIPIPKGFLKKQLYIRVETVSSKLFSANYQGYDYKWVYIVENAAVNHLK